MREEDSNWFSKWEEELPTQDELMPLSQTLITPDLAFAFDIRNHPGTGGSGGGVNTPSFNHHYRSSTTQAHPPPSQAEYDELCCASGSGIGGGGGGSGSGADESARTLKRPRLVWTPQLHKRFVDAVAHLGIKNAVPKTIMQLMSVDGLTRENVASHLQKYRLYLKRMQGSCSVGGNRTPDHLFASSPDHLFASSPVSPDHLFASSPVPPHFLHQVNGGGGAGGVGGGGRLNSGEQFMTYIPVNATALHHHQIPSQAQHYRQMGQFDQAFLARQAQTQLLGPNRNGNMLQNNSVFVEDLESNDSKKILTLFPTSHD